MSYGIVHEYINKNNDMSKNTELDIPGILKIKDDSEKKLLIEQMEAYHMAQRMMNTINKDTSAHNVTASLVGNTTTNNEGFLGFDEVWKQTPITNTPLYDHNWLKQQPYNKPQPLPFLPDKYKKFGPSPSITDDYTKTAEEMLKRYLKPGKSAFEELLDNMFSLAEKEQFLIDAGYLLDNDSGALKISRKLSDGTIKVITNTLDDLFLKEITMKFKNLLLAKPTLKLKI